MEKFLPQITDTISFGVKRSILNLTEDKDILCKYLREFDKATEGLVNGEDTMEAYNYYFWQLEDVAEIHKDFEYKKVLAHKDQDVYSIFYNLKYNPIKLKSRW